MPRPFDPTFTRPRKQVGVGTMAERRASKRLNARLTPGSGATDKQKGDMVTPDFLIESKATQGASMSVKLAWLEKIAGEARAINREPAVVVQYVDASGRPVQDGAWVMVPERVFREIKGA